MSRRKPPAEDSAAPSELERTFEGAARLQQLLAEAGVVADVEDVAEAFRAAQKDQAPAATVINALFDDEPRFASPKAARALFSNLFGLWDLLEAQPQVDLKVPAPRKALAPPPPPPGRYAKEGPDEAWVEGAWRWLEQTPFPKLQKLRHAYDHKTDSLVTWLDEQGLSELGFALAQHLLFELFAMLELGSSAGVGTCDAPAVEKNGADVPPALTAYAEEVLFEAEQDDDEPLPKEEAVRLHSLMGQALGALWKAANAA